MFIRQQTAVIDLIRTHLVEFGIVAPVGRKGVTKLLQMLPTPVKIKMFPEVPDDNFSMFRKLLKIYGGFSETIFHNML